MQAYLKGVSDPISADQTRSQINCNSAGLSQYGAQRWAIGNSDPTADPNLPNFPKWNYQQILTHYYTGVHIRNANTNAQLTPVDRWVSLTADWNTDPNVVSLNSPAMVVNQTYALRVKLQNSGAANWPSGTQISCQWERSGQTINGANSVSIGVFPTGSDLTVNNLLVQTPPSEGDYTLRIDLRVGTSDYFHDKKTGRPWFTQ